MSLRGRQVTASVAPTCRLLIVTVGGVCFAVQADYIKGLLTVDEAGPLETLTVQELTYPKMDFTVRLGLPHDPQGPETRIILFAKGQGRANIPVARVHGLQEIEQSQMLPMPRQFQREERNWYQGMVLFEEGVALVLNPSWIMEGCERVRITAMGQVEDVGQPVTMRPALAGGQV